MKTVSIRFSDMDKKTLLYLGYVGENLHRRILIDCKREFEEMPGAIPALVVTAPNGLKYPVDVTMEGNTVIWDITNSDLIHHGNGEIQLTLTKDSEVGKSAKCRTKVDESIEPDGEAPDPIENWLIRAENLLREIPEEIADAIEEAKESGMFDGVGISSIGYVKTVGKVNTYRINLTDGSFYDFEVSNGEDGQPGTNGVGIANIAKTGTVGLVDTYTITLTNGQTYPFTVTNGQNGAEIDDTTPALNKVFSSAKVNGELTQLKSDLTSISDDVDDLNDHETYLHGSTIEYEPVAENNHVDSNFIQINGYNYATFGSPFAGTTKIYPVVIGKTYKVISDGKSESPKMPFLIVADTSVTSGVIGTPNTYDSVLSESATEKVGEIEYTALRTGYLYLTASNSSCGLWLKKETGKKNFYIDDVRNNISDIDSVIDKITETKIDSASRPSKVVPRNAEPIAKVTSLANSVTLVRSILSRNVANKNAVGDVVVDSIGTTKKGIQTAWLPPGGYWIDLGNMGIYSMVKYFEKGVYSTTLWQDQFPMRVGITDPAGGFFVFYAENVSQLGDVSGLFVGKQRDGESVLQFEDYSEKTYTPDVLADDNRIEVVPYGIIEFVNSSNSAVTSTVEYTLFGKNDDTTTRKDFITSPDGTKFLPMIKNDGSVVAARVVPKKALFIGNSLTSGWQTFGEAATESDKDFVGRFGAVVADLDSDYAFNRKWSTQFEQQTSLANAQTWVTTNIDPLLDSDIDLIVVQLSDNVVGNDSIRATFQSSSLWLLQHLRTECPKARVVWLGVWFDRAWVTTLLQNTAQTGCEYVDMRPIYLPENVSYIGEVYKMDSSFQKDYAVDSFTVEDGHITLVFTVDGKQYTSTIPSYTSYESSGSTLTVTGLYHVVSTYYESIHPNDEGFRKIANKLLFDLGISDSEETIPAEE